MRSVDKSDTAITGVQAERNIKAQRQRDIAAMTSDQLLHDEALKDAAEYLRLGSTWASSDEYCEKMRLAWHRALDVLNHNQI